MGTYIFDEVISLRQVKHTLTAIGIVLCAIVLLSAPQQTLQAVQQSLRICSSSILPSIFPFFVITDLWVSMGYAQQLGRLAGSALKRLFHLPGEAASALLLGCLGGYPVGAKAVCDLYTSKRLSKAQTEAVLQFCNNAGPAFFLGVLGGSLLNCVSLGVVLWLIHLGSAAMIGLIFRPEKASVLPASVSNAATPGFLPAFTQAVCLGGQSALQVCSFVIFFSILAGHLERFLPETLFWTVVLGNLELAGGLYRLAQTSLSQQTLFVLSAALTGWGGLCVHCQSIAVIAKAGLSSSRYLLGKALHGILSLGIACAVAPVVCGEIPCFAFNVISPAEPAISVLLAWCVFWYLKTSSGNRMRHDV